MTKHIPIDFMQYRITIFLPKTLHLNVVSISEQLDKALTVYQKYINSDVNWYYFGNSIKIKPELLVYNAEGLTELAHKKLTFRLKRMEKTGDLSISFTDDCDDPYLEGDLISYGALKFYNEPLINTKIKFFFNKYKTAQTFNSTIQFVTGLAELFYQSYIGIDLMQTFSIVDTMFPKRLGTSMVLYIPAVLNANDYPEAHQIIPINHDDKQVGTVIVSLDHFPNSDNIEDIKTMNRLDVRLREADLLPLRRDLSY